MAFKSLPLLQFFKGLSLDLEGNDSFLQHFILSYEIFFFGEGRLM